MTNTTLYAPKDRKKLLMALYKKFKRVGDAYIRGGKHIIFDAIKIANHTLEDLTDGELRKIALEKGVLRPE